MRHQNICYVRQEAKQEKINHTNTLVVGYVGNLISHFVHDHTFFENLFNNFAIVQKCKIQISYVKTVSCYNENGITLV